jgi:endonuclease III related protein
MGSSVGTVNDTCRPARAERPRLGATRRDLLRVYTRLRRRYGHARWWPGKSALEVCLGAILTQNTSWTNVEKALARLRERSLLGFRALRSLPLSRLARLIRSSGCYNVKARRVRAFLSFVEEHYGGRVGRMATEPPQALRAKLLSVEGIGPETADSIALYAAGRPLFVVDAYTRRVFSRLGLVRVHAPYDEVQRFFMDRLPRDAALFNDYHAQIVRLAKDACRARPRCTVCPLEDVCPSGGIPAHAPAITRTED